MVVRGRAIALSEPASMAARTSGHIRSRWHFRLAGVARRIRAGIDLVSFDGAGTVLADLRLSAGQLDPGSYLDVPEVAATANALGNRFQGKRPGADHVQDAGKGELSHGSEAVMQRFSVAPADAPARPYVHGRDLRIEAVRAARATTCANTCRPGCGSRTRSCRTYACTTATCRKRGLRFTGGSGRVSATCASTRRTPSQRRFPRGRQTRAARAGRTVARGRRRHRHETASGRPRAAPLRRGRQPHLAAAGPGERRATCCWVRTGGARSTSSRRGSTGTSRCPSTAGYGPHVRTSRVARIYSPAQGPARLGRTAARRGEARAEGRVQWRPTPLLLEPFSAGNDRFDVHARMRLREKQPTGDLLAQWGVMSGRRRARGRPQGLSPRRRPQVVRRAAGSRGSLGSPGGSRAASGRSSRSRVRAAAATRLAPEVPAFLRPFFGPAAAWRPPPRNTASSSSSASPV